MASVTIRFFGPARDLTGQSSITLEVGDGETVGILAGRLAEKYARLGQSVGMRLAVNRAYVPLSHALADGDEVAVIPMVSGGSGPPRALLTREPIAAAKLVDQMRRYDAGAFATFSGTVRADAECETTLLALDYEAYEEMATEQMLRIRGQAIEKFGALDAAIVHRIGRMKLGETSIFVVVVSAHREAAFEACRWIVDRVKTDVPIWKKDVWSDGTCEWVDPTK
jgi:molybdopterin synthase catalytic subunit